MSEWHYLRDGKDVTGPVSEEAIREMLRDGKLQPSDWVSNDRAQSWEPADSFSVFNAPTAPAKSLPPIVKPVLEFQAPAGPKPPPRPPTFRRPDEEAGWYYSRDDAQLGPVSYGELRGLNRDGVLSARTMVWHQSLPDWQSWGSLTGFPVGPYEMHPFISMITRAFTSDLQTVKPSASEVNVLAAQGTTNPLVQQYYVWRRGILLFVIFPTIVSALLATYNVIYYEEFKGLNPLGAIMHGLHLVSLFALSAVALVAALQWKQLKLSRASLFFGWTIAFLIPIIIALLPIDWLVDMGTASTDEERMGQRIGLFVLGFVAGVVYFVQFLPTVISLMPGVVRACFRIKTLLPASIVPGWFLIAAAVVYALIGLPIFIAISKISGNALLLIGATLTLATPLVYVLFARTFIQPVTTPEELRRIGYARVIASITGWLSILLLVIYLFTKTVPLIDFSGQTQRITKDIYLMGFSEDDSFLRPWSLRVWKFIFDYVGGAMFMTVFAADMFMLLNISVWVNAKRFNTLPAALDYDQTLQGFDQGLTANRSISWDEFTSN